MPVPGDRFGEEIRDEATIFSVRQIRGHPCQQTDVDVPAESIVPTT